MGVRVMKGINAMRRVVFLVGLLAAFPALAMTDSSANIGTGASTPLAAASGTRSWVMLFNRSANNIWCSWTGTATVAGAGTFGLIGLGSNIVLSRPNLVPQEALSCIASGAGSGLTVLSVP